MSERGAALYEVLRQVRPLLLNSARVVEASLRQERLTVGTRAILMVLRDGGAATLPSVAEQLDLPRQSVQRHVADLLALGYVESRPNPAHRRSFLVALTDPGRDVVDRVARAERRDLADLAPECTADEISVAAKVVEALSRDVRRRAAALTGGSPDAH
jgi:DNA-binding MarR family transcriptional regulator